MLLHRLQASRSHFEALINNMNNPQPNPAPALGSLSVSGAAQTDTGASDLMAASVAR